MDGTGAQEIVYQAAQPQKITLTVRAIDELDPVVEILNLDGKHRLAYNDDYTIEGFSPTDAALIQIPLAEAGDYVIRVNSFNGVSAGEVEVMLTVVDPQPPSLVVLALNEIYTSELALEAGKTTSITARDPKGVLDPLIVVRDADGEIIASNDDHQSDDLTLNIFDARLTFTPAEDTVYILELREFLGRAGEFEITITP